MYLSLSLSLSLIIQVDFEEYVLDGQSGDGEGIGDEDPDATDLSLEDITGDDSSLD